MGDGVPDPTYDPSLEWPGDDTNTEHDDLLVPSASRPAHSSSTCRFIVRGTSILPRTQRLAVIEGYPEVQIGRDVAPPGSVTPRIRLKEMEVSKLHATIYWDDGRAEWGLVDMGSKHGTFHNRHHSGITSESKGSRLSPPRVASMPRYLEHLDVFSIGGTTFVVHIHGNGLPCSECSRGDDDEIPLFTTKATITPAHGKRKRDDESAYLPSDKTKDPKKALSLLKKSLLSQRPAEKPDSSAPTTWVDRSARRRAMHPPSPPLSRKQSPLLASDHSPPQGTPTVSTSSTSEPVSSNNIGYRMLAKQGWTPGTSLGAAGGDTQHVVEPITVPSTSNRAGLGSASTLPSPSQGADWREEGKQRLWSRFDS
jgi:pSer/pThr/pTyr-binding forkhead associated (FHA) protein